MSMSLFTSAAQSAEDPVDYPESDGNLMSDNTTHGDAIEYFHGVVSSVVEADDNAFRALITSRITGREIRPNVWPPMFMLCLIGRKDTVGDICNGRKAASPAGLC